MEIAYVQMKMPEDGDGLIKLRQHFYFENHCSSVKAHSTFLKYQEGIFLFYTYKEEPKEKKRCKNEFLAYLNENGTQYYVGNCSTTSDIERLKNAIIKSMSACYICRMWELEVLDFQDTGIYKQLLPLCEESGLMEHYRRTIKMLTEFDQKTNSNLLETAICYCNWSKYNEYKIHHLN